VDTSAFERSLFSAGHRHVMTDPKTNKPRMPGSTLSLENLVRSLHVDLPCQLHNSGNDAFMCLFALQKLLDPENTQPPTATRVVRNGRQAQGGGGGGGHGGKPLSWIGGPVPVPVQVSAPTGPVLTGMLPLPMAPISPYSASFPVVVAAAAPVEEHTDAGNEFGQIRRLPGRLRVPPTANAGGSRNSRGALDAEGRGSGRGVDGVSASMRSLALK